MNNVQKEALRKLQEAEDVFLISFGWVKTKDDQWKSPSWYYQRNETANIWCELFQKWIPGNEANTYRRGHAINSLKSHMNKCPDKDG